MAAEAAGTDPRVSPEAAFGDVIRRLRRERRLSQEQLGFESGYHRTYISFLERGRKSPSLGAIFQLAAALGVTPSELIRSVEARATVASRAEHRAGG